MPEWKNTDPRTCVERDNIVVLRATELGTSAAVAYVGSQDSYLVNIGRAGTPESILVTKGDIWPKDWWWICAPK